MAALILLLLLMYAERGLCKTCKQCFSQRSAEDCDANETDVYCPNDRSCQVKYYRYISEDGYQDAYWYKACVTDTKCHEENITIVSGKTRHIMRCCGTPGCHLGLNPVTVNSQSGNLRCPACYSNTSLGDCESNAVITECSVSPMEICMFRYSVFEYINDQQTWYKGCRRLTSCHNVEEIRYATETKSTLCCKQGDCTNGAMVTMKMSPPVYMAIPIFGLILVVFMISLP